MLVLTRRLNERIYLMKDGKQIGVISVCDIDRGKIRLGLQFDQEYAIYREELVPFNSVKEDSHGHAAEEVVGDQTEERPGLGRSVG